jgi:hypothetical protein
MEIKLRSKFWRGRDTGYTGIDVFARRSQPVLEARFQHAPVLKESVNADPGAVDAAIRKALESQVAVDATSPSAAFSPIPVMF